MGAYKDKSSSLWTVYISQQCNCITCNSHGLSKIISDKFSHGNIYGKRYPLTKNTSIEKDRDIPGTIKILEGNPNIICIVGQWSPGKVNGFWIKKYPLYHNEIETKNIRLNWFKNAINEIDEKVDIDNEIAIPYKIGCGLAGGCWDEYEKILQEANSKFNIYQI